MADSDSDNIPSDVEILANAALSTIIPKKSKLKYELEYARFQKWCELKKVGDALSVKILLAYFSEKAEKYKSSTLWTHYSMLRTTIALKRKVDISKYTELIAFLKRNGDGYKPKKSYIFSKDEIHKFLQEANDDRYLMIKVSLIIGVFGACRREELCNLKVTDIEDNKTFIKITLPNTKTKVIRQFVITKGNIIGCDCLDIFKKYFQLRPKVINHERFFIYYKNGKCTSQPVGINTFGRIPKEIATFLGLSNLQDYTGHCFRRSSATLLADAGADMDTLKRHGGWKSSSVAEGYVESVESSIENKKKIATKIMGVNENIVNVQNSSANISCVDSTSAGINISNCKKCIINVYNK